MSVVGIDLGTSGCRIAAYDRSATELASATRRYPLTRGAPGHVEVDATLVWEAVRGCLLDVNTRLAADPVTAVCVTAQGEAIVPVDADGEALDNAPVSVDLRAVEETEALVSAVGASRLAELTGQPPHPMFSVGKIAWWRRVPRVWDAATTFTSLSGFVNLCLGVGPAIDYTLAARTMAFDVHAREWSALILEHAGIPLDRLPAAVPVGTVLGRMPEATARGLGFTAPVDVVAGAHDQACAMWGMGVSEPSCAAWSLGTSECLTTVTEGWPGQAVSEGFACYPADDTDRYLLLAGIPSGGSTIDWLVDRFGGEYGRLSDRPSQLLVLPHFAGSGTVDNDPLSRGAFLGLTLETTRDEMVRALVEASGYEVARTHDLLAKSGVPINDIRAGGGGASPAAVAVRASAANHALTLVDGHATARGAAFVAGAATGYFGPIAEAGAALRTGDPLVPDATTQSWYAGQRDRHHQLYPLLRDISHAMSEGTTSVIGE
ncbi:FGGY-family carbohydrate kinase [Actinopolymorpha alba]|uniref:FGGY-family carbohydrate kinase n=1 Tax=Actinopolymorpha alba TaxID=533267 RepID=UPI00037AA500|nr:FGGY-family carbohydrate kinase [Actinopolymorpha alba]